jgi:superoxide reductase
MELQVVHTEKDEGQEKHVPVRVGRVVKVGEVAHPMEENHFIEWIEKVSISGKYARKHLKPGEAPEVPFGNRGGEILRCYCNVHGLWENNKADHRKS